jgi:hypothetical protein
MRQPRVMSLFEAITNVVVGYGLAVATQIVVFPGFGIEAALGEHLAIGIVFACFSLARGYLLRRLFERVGKGFSTVDSWRHEPPKES